VLMSVQWISHHASIGFEITAAATAAIRATHRQWFVQRQGVPSLRHRTALLNPPLRQGRRLVQRASPEERNTLLQLASLR